MTNAMGWRRLLTCATIDVLLITAAGSALAATGAPSASPPALPGLLLLGVGLFGGLRWRRHG